MNIVVKPYDCRFCYCRPDTTWERENKDFYIPNGIKSISWAPIAFARISKAGKCIGEKFVSRYYDSFNFGVLLYCSTNNSCAENEIAFTSCIDHSSILPSPLYNTIAMEGEENEYKVKCKDHEIFKIRAQEIKPALEKAIITASAFTSLRIGDYVALELDKVTILAEKGENETSIKGTFCENNLFDLKLIF